MMLSASDSDTSTSDKLSAISIAPTARDVTPGLARESRQRDRPAESRLFGQR
jgi:hypothetical protein